MWINKLIAAGRLEHQNNTDNADCMEVTKVTALYPSYKRTLRARQREYFAQLLMQQIPSREPGSFMSQVIQPQDGWLLMV